MAEHFGSIGSVLSPLCNPHFRFAVLSGADAAILKPLSTHEELPFQRPGRCILTCLHPSESCSPPSILRTIPSAQPYGGPWASGLAEIDRALSQPLRSARELWNSVGFSRVPLLSDFPWWPEFSLYPAFTPLFTRSRKPAFGTNGSRFLLIPLASSTFARKLHAHSAF